MTLRNRPIRKLLAFVLPPISLFVLLIGVWQAIVVIGDQSRVHHLRLLRVHLPPLTLFLPLHSA